MHPSIIHHPTIIRPSMHPSIIHHPCIHHLSIHPSMHPFIHPSIISYLSSVWWITIYPSIYLSISLSIYSLVNYFSIYPSIIYLSIYLWVIYLSSTIHQSSVSQWFSSMSNSAFLRRSVNIWRHFLLSQLGGLILLACGGWRPGMQLHTPQCTGRSPTSQSPPAPNVS